MKPEDLERLLEQKLSQHEQQRTALQNLAKVKAKLAEVYGPNHAQHLRRQAAELEVSEQFLQNMAQANPKALFKLLGIGEVETGESLFETPPKNQLNTTTGLPKGQVRGDSYYEEIRKNRPNEYWTPKIQNEIFERIKEMGAEKFSSS